FQWSVIGQRNAAECGTRGGSCSAVRRLTMSRPIPLPPSWAKKFHAGEADLDLLVNLMPILIPPRQLAVTQEAGRRHENSKGSFYRSNCLNSNNDNAGRTPGHGPTGCGGPAVLRLPPGLGTNLLLSIVVLPIFIPIFVWVAAGLLCSPTYGHC